MDNRRNITRQKIKEAYVALLKRSDPNHINVSSICKEANINRSTFYEHFPYIERLIEDIIKDQLEAISRVNDELLDEWHFNDYTSPADVERYLRNFASNETLLRLSRQGNHYKVLIANLSIRYELIKYKIVEPANRINIIYRNYGVFAIIFGWLDKTIDMSVEDVSLYLYRQIVGE